MSVPEETQLQSMPRPRVTVAVQAGGKSSRMGEDKSFVLYEGRPMIEVVLERAGSLGQETIIISNNSPPYRYLGLPIFGDVYPDAGPLGGIYTALAAAEYGHVLIVACDMPRLNTALLRYMLSLRHEADLVVPRWDRFPEPLHAVYSKACLAPIEARLRLEEFKITGFFPAVNVRFIDRDEIARFDPEGHSFTNVNRPEDLPGAKT